MTKAAKVSRTEVREAEIQQTGISGMLSRALDANLRFTSLATQMAATALESAFSVASGLGTGAASDMMRLAASAEPRGEAKASQKAGDEKARAAIVLEGVAGSTPVGFFVVENSLSHAIEAAVEVSPLTSADGRTLESVLRFSPGTIALAPGEQVVARVTAKISRRLVAGMRYEGQILVPGVAGAGGAQIPIVLRRNAEAAAHAPVGKASRVKATTAKKAGAKKAAKAGKKAKTKAAMKTVMKAASKKRTTGRKPRRKSS